MREVVSYGAAGILVVLACSLAAPWAGMTVGASPTAQPSAVRQFVDRAHKSDRLPEPTAFGRQQKPAKPQPMMVGCDPAFSPLSTSANANFPARCVARLSVAPEVSAG